MKVAFSKQVVLSLPVGTHTDTKVTGLVCTVTNSSRRFGIYLSVHGKPVRRSIGNTFDWSVEAARLEAQTIISELRKAPATPKETFQNLQGLALGLGAGEGNGFDRAGVEGKTGGNLLVWDAGSAEVINV